jgi:hypothetical protein
MVKSYDFTSLYFAKGVAAQEDQHKVHFESTISALKSLGVTSHVAPKTSDKPFQLFELLFYGCEDSRCSGFR